MPDVTVRVRITKAERLDERWRVSADGVLPMETDPRTGANEKPFDKWVGRYATLVVNPQDQIISAHLTTDPPECKCCGGSGMHEYRASVRGRSPDDDDIECSACSGRGMTWFDTQRNSCSGFRDLMRSVQR